MKRSETSLTDVLGEKFGPYELVRRLGVGGMAETFVAVKSGPGGFTQRVCLKLVLPFFRDDEDFVRLFYREATLAAKLRHRNIVGVLDFGEFEGTPYMTLALVNGLDLRSILDTQEGGRLPPEYVTLFGLELAEALQHAHHPPSAVGIEASGIVHRDISPSNVLVSRQGEILLTDFGVAKAISDTSRRQSAVKGKVPYMSPEQLRAESLDGRADLFALGVVLFEALAGQRPYEGAHDPATIMLILKGEHPPLSQFAPDAPEGLRRVIEQLISPDKEARPATAAALIEALDEFAPSPRVRLKLGRLVTELADDADAKRKEKGSGRVGAAKTDVLPDAATFGVGTPGPSEPSSRVEASAPAPSIPSEVEAPAATPSDAPPEPKHELVSEPLNLVRPPRAGAKRAMPAATRAGSLDPDLSTLREERRPRRQEKETDEGRRKLWMILAGSVLGVALITSAAVVMWPPGDAEDAATDEAARGAEATEPEGEPEHGEPAEEREMAVAEPEPETDVETRTGVEEPESAGSPSQTPIEEEEAERRTPEPPTPVEAAEERAEPPAPPPPPTPERREQANQPARLTITVFPWGNIWINGQPWGAAPLKNETMKPGVYRISAGQAGPTETQTVRLRAGKRRTVRFDLTE